MNLRNLSFEDQQLILKLASDFNPQTPCSFCGGTNGAHLPQCSWPRLMASVQAFQQFQQRFL